MAVNENIILTNRIRLIRISYGYTQADIADKLSISSSAYGKIERNPLNASIKTLKKISSAIGVSFRFLIDIENNNHTE
ncbi:MAG: helix-turn-helix transcriptional regulator [Bacteroidetes bacterium]|nr:helix-turn-helix transcriptional regulator [Bacteroidota bacterium]